MSRRLSLPLTLLGFLAAAPVVAQPPQVAPAPRPKQTARFRVDLRLDDATVRAGGPGAMTPATPPCCAAACCDSACPAPTANAPVRVIMAGPARPAPVAPPAVYARQVVLPPAPPLAVCPPLACPQPPCPPGVPADTWQTMVGAFGDMLNTTCPPPGVHGLPYAVAVPLPGSAVAPCPTLPPTVAAVTYAAPPMHAPVMPAVAVARANPMPVGTWYREIGPVRMTLSLKGDGLSLTTTMSATVDGKAVTQGLLVTADCHPTRDGLVGVITGADVVLDGEMPDEAAAELAKVVADVGKVQKALADKPFALSCRVVDGCLMVSNVRMAAAKVDGNSALDGMEDGALIAGRYKPAGPGGPPKQKAVKVDGPVTVTTAEVTLPSPRYLEHAPQYFAPDPSFPLSRELTAQQVEAAPACPVAPEPRAAVKAAACEQARPDLRAFSGYDVVGLGTRVDGAPACPPKMTLADVIQLSKVGLADEIIVTQLRLTGSTFALTVDDLVVLKRAGVPDAVIHAMQLGRADGPCHLTPERIHGGIMLNSYSADPNVRMSQLLYQSEDIRPIGEAWRRFWFQDLPSHLTPERIHGGIQ